MFKHRCVTIIIVLQIVLLRDIGRAQDLEQVLDLRGRWKFELGDESGWSKRDFDDSKWDIIQVPSPWEDQGYPGYDGYAWYRKHFRVDNDFYDKPLYLRLGHIDDAGEIFLNGHMIGYVGTFPPNFSSGYGIDFRCPVPQDFLLAGSDNVIAVRVYDYKQAGGLTHGSVGFYQPRDFVEPDYDLSGAWKFKIGDDKEWALSSFDDSHWKTLRVPLLWDAQGYEDYDGYAWYRVKFRVPHELSGKRLVLLVGRIDDFDEAYLNGKLIGHTGDMQHRIARDDRSSAYQQLRAYTIPPSLLLQDQENTLAVRVLDIWMHGGIYDGPVGLVTRDRYLAWKDRPRSLWDALKQFIR